MMSFASIPPTSHSAPIDEYIVLWTADKYKKLKKWHDGYLRYHTFNKRLMVYDHLMNKVCDKFLPEPEPIDVGDELIFDSHLVTIEDIKGRQTQDLRPLFEKTVDRRKERGSTTTPIRTVGTPASSEQSPTPTLLRTIQSRPSTGHGRPVYPSPVARPSPREVESNVVVPQKRTSQGAPIVQKISYKPFKVSRVEGSDISPVQTKITKNSSGAVIKNRGRPKSVTQVSPDLGLATNILDADDDIEMLELDLERSDFAQRPKPSGRILPNAPPPFKPPRPQSTAQNGTEHRPDDMQEELPLPPPLARTVVPVSQVTNPLGSSPRIPPSTITNYSQELLSSPSFRSRPNVPPILAQKTPKKKDSSPIVPPSPVPSPDLVPEEVQESGRLTLPSATSRSRRKLLCGPSGRASKMVSLSRPVSTLSILDTFPKGSGSSEPVGSGVVDKKPRNETKLSVPPLKTNSARVPERPGFPNTNPTGQNAPKRSSLDLPGKTNPPEGHWKPLWNHNSGPGGSNSPDDQTPHHRGAPDIKVSEQDDKSNKKSQNKSPKLCIFSSDEEDLDIMVSKPAPKKLRTSLPPDSDSSGDEFEPMRSSAVPKHLVGQSRNVKLQSCQAVSEASRVWREGEGEFE
ncbi:hypothetical protein TWF970_005784 [Orbilia oligospora]|uniref:5'-3' DNA helicase ZGRF1-like N-terminal domain-containing protein n=1 Tax=Orbilia oligospora TaxID=2813651 RepID=A0A7C8RNF4_ORBOL|nr:hypothetical protein TWF970_005784 [Orbilia oligospora]